MSTAEHGDNDANYGNKMMIVKNEDTDEDWTAFTTVSSYYNSVTKYSWCIRKTHFSDKFQFENVPMFDKLYIRKKNNVIMISDEVCDKKFDILNSINA